MRVGVDNRHTKSQSITGLSAKGCLFLKEIINFTIIPHNTSTALQAEVSVLLNPKQYIINGWNSTPPPLPLIEANNDITIIKTQ